MRNIFILFSFILTLISCTKDSKCITCIETATTLNARYEICDDGKGGSNVTATVAGTKGNPVNAPDITPQEFAEDLEVTGVATCNF